MASTVIVPESEVMLAPPPTVAITVGFMVAVASNKLTLMAPPVPLVVAASESARPIAWASILPFATMTFPLLPRVMETLGVP